MVLCTGEHALWYASGLCQLLSSQMVWEQGCSQQTACVRVLCLAEEENLAVWTNIMDIWWLSAQEWTLDYFQIQVEFKGKSERLTQAASNKAFTNKPSESVPGCWSQPQAWKYCLRETQERSRRGGFIREILLYGNLANFRCGSWLHYELELFIRRWKIANVSKNLLREN